MTRVITRLLCMLPPFALDGFESQQGHSVHTYPDPAIVSNLYPQIVGWTEGKCGLEVIQVLQTYHPQIMLQRHLLKAHHTSLQTRLSRLRVTFWDSFCSRILSPRPRAHSECSMRLGGFPNRVLPTVTVTLSTSCRPTGRLHLGQCPDFSFLI